MNDDREFQLKIKEHELYIIGQADGFKQTNQASVDFAIKTIWALFLLNGSAATALLASRSVDFYPAAIILGFGALSAVIAFALSYVYCLMLGETWRDPPSDNGFDQPKYPFNFFVCQKTMSYNEIMSARLYPIIPVLVAVVLFILGMANCYQSLK